MKIADLTKYIIENYPYPDELSKARINKIIYLIDWKFVLEHGRQMTYITWKFNHYGPYVDDIIEEINNDKRFDVVSAVTFYGNQKNIIKLANLENFTEPTEKEKKVIDFVIEKTKKFYWNDFIKLVYSTYPIISQEKGSCLNLIELAKEYKELLAIGEKK